MSIFGEDFPALWPESRTQQSEVVTSTTIISGSVALLTFLNAHDYEVGMMIKLTGFTTPTMTVPYYGFAYVLGKTSIAVTIDYDTGTGAPTGNANVKGYIGLENIIYDATDYKQKDKIERASISNGDLFVKTKGSYSLFDITLNTLRMSEVNRVNFSKLLMDFEEEEDLTYFPHVDTGLQIKDYLGSNAYFTIDVSFLYWDSIDFRDRIKIKIKSKKYTNVKSNIG